MGSNPIFFPSTAIKKDAFVKSGGLSNIRRHSSDSQFYCRGHFYLNLQNVDEFLYLRVKHENALTTSPETALGTPVRNRLGKLWMTGFDNVKRKKQSPNETTLVDESFTASIDLIPMEEAFKGDILAWQRLSLSLGNRTALHNFKHPTFPKVPVLKSRQVNFIKWAYFRAKVMIKEVLWLSRQAILRISG